MKVKMIGPHRHPIGGPGGQLGILVSIHPDMMTAFAANDAFQKTGTSGRNPNRHERSTSVPSDGRSH